MRGDLPRARRMRHGLLAAIETVARHFGGCLVGRNMTRRGRTRRDYTRLMRFAYATWILAALEAWAIWLSH